MNPYRTRTVVALCESMRQAGDYSATPILADALQDAGFDHTEWLRQLRESRREAVAERLVALVYSDETGEAVRWMEQFAARVGYDYETAIFAAKRFVRTGEPYRDTMGQNWDASNEMHDDEKRELFWRNFQLITGARVPDEFLSDRPFECPC